MLFKLEKPGTRSPGADLCHQRVSLRAESQGRYLSRHPPMQSPTGTSPASLISTLWHTPKNVGGGREDGYIWVRKMKSRTTVVIETLTTTISDLIMGPTEATVELSAGSYSLCEASSSRPGRR